MEVVISDPKEPKTVRCRNPKNGVVYVYTYELFFDPAQQKYRQRRRCIGKVDENGEVVPTLPRGAARKGARKTEDPGEGEKEMAGQKEEERFTSLTRQIQELQEKVHFLEAELSKSHREILELKDSKARLKRAIESVLKNY